MSQKTKVLISGGKGLVGKALCENLLRKGYDVAVLTRNPKENQHIKEFFWDTISMEIDNKAIEYAENIIHLAGENIGSERWTRKRKKQIIESRINSTLLLASLLKKGNIICNTFVSASATGFYGSHTSDHIFTEEDISGNDFTGITCLKWENTVDNEISAHHICKLRTAVVLSSKGGVVEKFSLPAQFGIYPLIGGGKQYFPWISIDDLVNMYIYCLENQLSGVYNAVAPQHLSFKDFIHGFKGERLGIKIYIPAFLLKWILGEMSCIVLEGSRISSHKIQKAGFIFKYPGINSINF